MHTAEIRTNALTERIIGCAFRVLNRRTQAPYVLTYNKRIAGTATLSTTLYL